MALRKVQTSAIADNAITTSKIDNNIGASSGISGVAYSGSGGGGAGGNATNLSSGAGASGIVIIRYLI